MAGIAGAAAAYKHFEKRNSRHPMLWSVLTGAVLGAGSFAGSQYAAEYVSDFIKAHGAETPIPDPTKAAEIPSGGATATEQPLRPLAPGAEVTPQRIPGEMPRVIPKVPEASDLAPELRPEARLPGAQTPRLPSDIQVPRIPDVGKLAPELTPEAQTPGAEVPQPRPAVPEVVPRVGPTVISEITPELASALRQGGLSALVDNDQRFAAIIESFGLNNDAVLQLKDALMRTLSERDWANKLVNMPGDVVRNGSVVFPSEGTLDMNVFGDKDFTARLRSVILESEKTHLAPALGGRSGVGEFIKDLRSAYAR
jgi:hypothetical protein